ncbi:MAG: cupin domain-containing protein [Myxococcales bacterium]|nr:cupin domain-containing protein [Myxococcales bacterium]MDD9968007.1 cupin domain-containing protein [Myxococcales bacterium]
MSGVQHHLPADLLLSFASGTGDVGGDLLVATHLTLCPRCRDEVAHLEALGGALLDEIDGEAIARDPHRAPVEHSRLTFDGPVKRRDANDEHVGEAAEIQDDGVLPRALLSLVGPVADITWTSGAFGQVHYLELPIEHAHAPLRLVRFKQGMRIPTHSHAAQEIVVYLTGAATDLDHGIKYQRGDVSTYGPGQSHQLAVEQGEDCITLIANMRLVGKTLMSRLVFRLLGWC